MGCASFSSLFLATVILTVGCTGKHDSASLRITMPGSFSTVAATSAPHKIRASSVNGDDDAWNTALNPANGAELNCFAVFIGGPGLTGKSCSVNTAGVLSKFEFGERQFVGLVPAGETISMAEIPPGARVINVVGFKAAAKTDCSKNLLPNDIDKTILSEPFLIAQHSQNLVSGNNDVSIQPVLDLNKKIMSCTFNANDSMKDGVPMFGDRRDGTLRLGGTAAQSLTTNTNRFNFSGDIQLISTAGGPAATKIFGAQRQITNVSNVTGDTVELAGTFTADEFQVGDEVMWYVSAGASSSPVDDEDKGACGSGFYQGSYGNRKIVSIGASTNPGNTVVKLSSPMVDTPSKIKNANLTASNTSDNYCRISLLRIPNFDAVIVPASATWTLKPNPYSAPTGIGGIVAFRTKKLDVSGTLNILADGAGFSGGSGSTSPGESIGGVGVAPMPNGNSSGGGTGAGVGGAGGAGGGEGGASTLTGVPFGGKPLNFCHDTVQNSVSAGARTTCVISALGETRCWGQGSTGALGDGSLATFRTVPAQLQLPEPLRSTTSGTGFSCGLGQSNKLYCWGINNTGQLGDGTTSTRTIPVTSDPGTTYATVSSGTNSSCGITTGGTLKCWGLNTSGQLGDGTTITRMSPVTIDGGTSYKSVSVGADAACGVTVTDVLKCWGANSSGQLGLGNFTPSLVPMTVGPGFQMVSVGTYHACALIAGMSSLIKCWGDNSTGELGDGTTTLRNTPTVVAPGGGFYTSLSTTAYATCAINTTGNVFCWGLGSSGQLGNGAVVNRLTPTSVTTTAIFKSISMGDSHACGVTDTGTIQCWGNNTYGQLGTGDLIATTYPVSVRTQNVCRPISDQKMFMAGGGGSGLVAGGNGGGLILVYAKETTGTGFLNLAAKGQIGSSASQAGGGGGGGTIGFNVKSHTLGTTTVSATGGNGASGTIGSAGSGGGGGVIEMKYCAASSTSGYAATTFDVIGGLQQSATNPGARGIFKLESADLCSVD